MPPHFTGLRKAISIGFTRGEPGHFAELYRDERSRVISERVKLVAYRRCAVMENAAKLAVFRRRI